MKVNRYLYNGKELVSDHNLNIYDYGARGYDPVIGRWSIVDPLAEERQWLSPYNYVQNNLMGKIDPDGKLDTDCQLCKDLIEGLPDISTRINVTIGAQAGIKIGEVFEADITAINTDILTDESSFKDGELHSSKQIGPLVATPEGGVKNSGKAIVENSVSLKGFGFGGKIGQRQEIDGDLISSNYRTFSERGTGFAGFEGKIVTETDHRGNQEIINEAGFSIGWKFIIGVELTFKITK